MNSWHLPKDAFEQKRTTVVLRDTDPDLLEDETIIRNLKPTSPEVKEHKERTIDLGLRRIEIMVRNYTDLGSLATPSSLNRDTKCIT